MNLNGRPNLRISVQNKPITRPVYKICQIKQPQTTPTIKQPAQTTFIRYKIPNKTEFQQIELKKPDNVKDAYCRCCFKFFASSCTRNEISMDFINAIRSIFNLPMTFREGSKSVCDSCKENVSVFWKFKKEIIKRQSQFIKLVAAKRHTDLLNVLEIAPQLEAKDVEVEEIIIKEEPTMNSIFVAELPTLEKFENGSEKEQEKKESKDLACAPRPRKKKIKKVAKEQKIHVIPKITKSSKRCNICFHSYIDIIGHAIRRHGHIEIFKCSAGDFQAETRAKVLAHIRYKHSTHGLEGKKSCHICGKLFNARFIEHHVENVHNRARNYFCDLCPFSSYKREALLLHMQSNHLPKQVKCQHCDFTTINKRRLKMHCLNLHPELFDQLNGNSKRERIMCQIDNCRQTFKKTYSLEKHIKRVHQGELNFACDALDCERKFFCSKEMKAHFENIHGPKNVICEICGGAYGSKSILKKHLFAHAQLNFVCDICGNRFKRRSSINFHMGRCHVSQSFKCDRENCKAAFGRPNDLKRHISEKHIDIRFDCQVPGCKSSLGRKDVYIGHLKAHKELSKDERDEIMKKLRQFLIKNNLVKY